MHVVHSHEYRQKTAHEIKKYPPFFFKKEKQGHLYLVFTVFCMRTLIWEAVSTTSNKVFSVFLAKKKKQKTKTNRMSLFCSVFIENSRYNIKMYLSKFIFWNLEITCLITCLWCSAGGGPRITAHLLFIAPCLSHSSH